MNHTPLVIGVTGHRDIDPDDARLRATVLDELERLRAAAPDRPVVVVSCLAEGADRLVARLAVEALGAELEVPLPLPPSEYARDFSTPASRQEFERLLAGARRAPVLFDRTRPPGSYQEAARSRQYARAGAWLVQRCSVLIALWDGEPARGLGGTGDLVRWMLEGGVPAELQTWPSGAEPTPRAEAVWVVHINPITCEVAYLKARG